MSNATKPKFEVGQQVRLKSQGLKKFGGPVLERLEDDGEWFYRIDSRNYLHEAMIELAHG